MNKSAFSVFMLRFILTTLFALLAIPLFSQQTATVYGKLTDEDKKPIPNANISLLNSKTIVQTDLEGNYAITVPANDTAVLKFTCIGFTTELRKVLLEPDMRYVLVIKMKSIMLDKVDINALENGKRIPVKELESIPYTMDPLTAILQALGAVSNNELTSQYSIRGGNYDENLVYVNDFEVYRPLLVRSGQQEGLPFPNYDLIDNIIFSAGGFEAKYGDKLSSVLDIQYKKPTEFEAGVTASLLGASFYANDVIDSGKMYYLFGSRYKTNKYLLNSLNTEGQYEPVFIDAQALVGININDKSSLEFLGNFAYNSYKFLPQSRSTATGVVNNVIQLDVFFDGQEIDEFVTGFGGVSYIYHPGEHTTLKLLGSGYHSLESETFDIIGQYWLGLVETNLGDEDFGDVKYGLGVGTFQNFARNYLTADVINLGHVGTHETKAHYYQWGVRVQTEIIRDELKEWELLDSAGYSLPYTGESVELQEVFKSDTELNSMRYSGYLQDTWEPDFRNFALTGGIRASYWDLNEELTISPRFQFVWQPEWHNKKDSLRDIEIKAAAGMYHQPPFYRELRDLEGVIHEDVQSQKSLHFVLGVDYEFKAWNRDFKFISEVYYKYLFDLIPYDVENVRIRYYGDNSANGYATGIEFRLHGEIVEDADSWISMSIMRTMENIQGDSTFDYHYNAEGQIDSLIAISQGYIPRPTDQLINFGMFFQDYMPGNENFKVHLSFLFGTGLPFGPPDNEYYRNSLRIPPYRRVDIGFSALLLDQNRDLTDKGRLNTTFESLWASIEVFNLLGIQNTISYIWVKDINNLQYAFPNYLTDRRLNFKLVAKF
ncbi:MAG: TonB-dependent receptor [Chitinophagales bacterium]|nr:TonB-dependent receptor [Bacteroidota bacterium]MBK7568249.1 TonB-dependent receptor [Bacteroidota bacterium]MBP8917318.1 TonB-dependent receptor [Chitinophagales bacterium]MBP9220653.1 TonB-dependent receptor [Chitinophagales bacterium]